MKKLFGTIMTMIGALALLFGNMAIMPASLFWGHEPNCPDEFLR